MKKVMMMVALAAVIGFSSCAEKTMKEKMQEAAEQAQEDLEEAGEEIEEAAEEEAKESEKGLKGLKEKFK